MKRTPSELPIVIQIAEKIENDIIDGTLPEETQVPPTNQFAAFYQINPATAAKGVNQLVDQGILYKKRGIGMFVKEGSRAVLDREAQGTILRSVRLVDAPGSGEARDYEGRIGEYDSKRGERPMNAIVEVNRLRKTETDRLRGMAYTVTGPAAKVDAFVRGKRELHREPFGGSVSAVVMGAETGARRDREEAERAGLEFATASLRQLIVYLTKDGISTAKAGDRA